MAVALGSNLGDRRATLMAALDHLAARVGPIEAVSSLHETEALIHPDDPALSYPAYLNAVAVLRSEAPPLLILDALQGIEKALGRDRATESARWRPRLVDLDLIAIDDVVLDDERLVLPHPEMHRRSFVLAPMAEAWPDWRHPVLHRSVTEMLTLLG